MTWEIFLGITALVGFIVGIVKLVVPLTNAITKLTVAIENMREDMKNDKTVNQKEHEKLWKHCEDQDVTLDDHESRIFKIETERQMEAKFKVQ